MPIIDGNKIDRLKGKQNYCIVHLFSPAADLLFTFVLESSIFFSLTNKKRSDIINMVKISY